MLGRKVWAQLSLFFVAVLLLAPFAWADVPNPLTDLNGDGSVTIGDMLIVAHCRLFYETGQPIPSYCLVTDPHPAGAPDGDWDADDLYEVQENLG